MKLFAAFIMPWPSMTSFLGEIGEIGFNVETMGRDYPWHQEEPIDVHSGRTREAASTFGMVAHGDRYSASQQTFMRGDYSTIHPLIIEFDVPEEDVRVAAEPLLVPLLRFIQQRPEDAVISATFGPAIHGYIDRAMAAETDEDRVAIALEASADPDIVRGHLANPREISIDYFSQFRTLYLVKLPVLPKEIVGAFLADRTSSEFFSVYDPTFNSETPLAAAASAFAAKYVLSRIRDRDLIF
ncbi:hypothetical protein [Bosea sp. (in: a-proteobacteria)]|uniref:hypothetical protein n=1 Tax=Bosea sp. (in: a-proteobacteria) TaxID=1871050 RepID=UPI002734598E|nr:hypothetical protein [Bosea sp. (in: a-proteobacteria)]MDP3258658.1 hypothetical protein [Bosea sp. (in: a-proteobacteria)]